MSDREEYYIYYDDKTENIPFVKHIEPLPPNENQIVVHNTTNYDNNFSDTSFMLINIFLHLMAVLFVFEIGKTCYRNINRNNNNRNNRNNNNERLVIRPNPNYYHNKVVVIEEISDELCSICLEPLYDKEDLENNKPVISLKCNHMFHKECLDPWVINHKCCPLCKRNT
jgi:hypothetical protein